MRWTKGRWRFENFVFVFEKDVEFSYEFEREILCWLSRTRHRFLFEYHGFEVYYEKCHFHV